MAESPIPGLPPPGFSDNMPDVDLGVPGLPPPGFSDNPDWESLQPFDPVGDMVSSAAGGFRGVPGDSATQGDIPTTGQQAVPDIVRAVANTLKRGDPAKVMPWLKSIGYEVKQQPSGEMMIGIPQADGSMRYGGLEQSTFDSIGGRLKELGKDVLFDSADDVLEASLQTALMPGRANLLGNVAGAAEGSLLANMILQAGDQYATGTPTSGAELMSATGQGAMTGAMGTVAEAATPIVRSLFTLASRPVAHIADNGQTLLADSFYPSNKSASGLSKESFYKQVQELEQNTDFFGADTSTFDDVVKKAIRRTGGTFEGKYSDGELGPIIAKNLKTVSANSPGVPLNTVIDRLDTIEKQLVDEDLIALPESTSKKIRAYFNEFLQNFNQYNNSGMVPLEAVDDLRKSLDRKVGDAFTKSRDDLLQSRSPLIVAYRDIAQSFRGLVAEEAGNVGAQAVKSGNLPLAKAANELKAAKREFQLIKQNLPDFEAARIAVKKNRAGEVGFGRHIDKAVAYGTGGAFLGSQVGHPGAGFALGATTGFLRSGVGDQPLTQASEQAFQKAMFGRSMRDLPAPSLSNLGANPTRWFETPRAAFGRTPLLAPFAAVASTPMIIARNVDEALKDDGAIGYMANALKNHFMGELAKGIEWPDAPEAQAAIMNQLEINAQDQAQPILNNLMAVQQRGDKQEMAVEMAGMAHQFPSLFAKARTGYNSEVTYDGKTYLVHPEDQSAYRQRLRKDQKMDLMKKAHRMNALNFDGQVIR